MEDMVSGFLKDVWLDQYRVGPRGFRALETGLVLRVYSPLSVRVSFDLRAVFTLGLERIASFIREEGETVPER
jgi:hypothetical protein